jgi:FixJ family two-component response regulator
MAIESPPTSRWPIFPYGPIDDLIAAINRAIERAAREPEERLKRADGGREISKLTDRELQMLLRIVKGMQHKEMVEEYGLSERTVKYHRTVLTRRIDRYASVDLARLADRLFLFLIRDSRHATIRFLGRFGHFTGP